VSPAVKGVTHELFLEAGVFLVSVKLDSDDRKERHPRNGSRDTCGKSRSNWQAATRILSYSRARGLFAGISLSGSTLRPDNSANKKLYGREISARTMSPLTARLRLRLR